MNAREKFLERLESLQNDPSFLTEQLILEINEAICRLMQEQGVSRAELARRIGVQRSYITRMLNGMPNLTLSTLVKIATALNGRVSFDVTQNHCIGEASDEGDAEPELKMEDTEAEAYALSA